MPRKKSLFKGKPYWALKRDTESRETDTETAGPSTDLGQCPDEPVFVQTQLPVNEPEEFIPMIDTDTVQFVSEEGLLIIKNYKDLQEEEDVQVDIGLETGIGKSGVDRLADVLQLHYKGHSKMWAQKTRKMLLLAKSHARSVLSNARERVRRIILEENGIEYCQETPVEVAVSYDGTWSKRGFTANFGFGLL